MAGQSAELRDTLPLLAGIVILGTATQWSAWRLHLEGRTLFGPGMTIESIDDALDDGAMIKITKLTAEFTLQSFRELYGTRAVPLFVIDGRWLAIVATDSVPAPQPGQSIVSLLLREPPAPPASEAASPRNEPGGENPSAQANNAHSSGLSDS